MIKAESEKKQRAVPRSRAQETTVIGNRRTAVFVTRIKHALVARARDQGRSPAQTIIVPTIKFEAYYRYGRWLAREFLKDKGEGIKDKLRKTKTKAKVSEVWTLLWCFLRC